MNILIAFVEDRAGHDKRYAIDATKLANAVSQSEKFPRKLENELSWIAEKVNAVNVYEEVLLGYCIAREATLGCENFDSGIVKTIEWYLNKYEANK